MADDRLIRIEDKLDKVVEHIGNIDVSVAVNTADMKEHIRRTEILETEIQPIKKHVAMVNGALKLIGFLALIGSGIEGITYIWKHLGA